MPLQTNKKNYKKNPNMTKNHSAGVGVSVNK